MLRAFRHERFCNKNYQTLLYLKPSHVISFVDFEALKDHQDDVKEVPIIILLMSICDSETRGAPDILLSGDDNGKLYLLRPANTPITAWIYTSTVIYDSSPGTIGGMAVGDINHDNYTEIIIPSYDANKITILTYRPGGTPTGMYDNLSDIDNYQSLTDI